MAYSEARKEQVLKRMLSPQAPSLATLARETGIASSTLWRWRHKLLPSGSPMNSSSKTPQQKAQLVLESLSLSPLELGPFLRLHGVCEADLLAWKQLLLNALEAPAADVASKAQLRELKAKTKRLERELLRKDKALAEAAALLILQKKIQSMWADEDTNT